MNIKKTIFIFLISPLILWADEFDREHRDPGNDIVFIDTAPRSPQKPYAEKSYDEPRGAEVVIVAGVTLSPAPDNAFFTKYRTTESSYDKGIIDPKKSRDIIIPTIYIVLGKFDKRDYVTAIYHLGNDSEINSVKIQIPRDRVVKIDYMTAYLADMEIFGINLPVSMEFSLPKNVNYVYIGSFIYEWEPYGFKIKNREQIDDYNNAVKFVAEKYGADAKLERVQLREITKKADTKTK